MAIYMKIDGIDGHATAKGHENWIEIDSVDFNVQRNINTKPGGISDRETTVPSVGEIVITKTMDKASPHLFSESCVGKAKNVQIDVCQTSDQPDPYMTYKLNNVLLSNYTVSAADRVEKSAPKETVNLNFDKIEMKYTQYDSQHNKSSAIPAGYDLKTGTKI